MSGPAKPAALRHPLVLESPSYSPDGAGGMIESWVELGRVWAALDPRGGSETGDGGVLLSRGRWRITVRAAPEGAASRPTPRQRFRLGARVFQIRAVQEDGPGARYLRCDAVEEVTT